MASSAVVAWYWYRLEEERGGERRRERVRGWEEARGGRGG